VDAESVRAVNAVQGGVGSVVGQVLRRRVPFVAGARLTV
jgi:hypothetical protein